MKIRKLQLKNIGVFDDETIEFQPCSAKDKAEIHIFTGQNGSGKSTILMALANTFDGRPNPNNLIFELKKRIKKIGGAVLVEIKFDNESLYRFTNDELLTASTNNNLLSIYQRQVYSYNETDRLSFAAFVFSGNRQIKGDNIQALNEPTTFNPLYQSLDFVKDYNQENQLTINQLIANNISKSAIEKGRNEEKSKKFANVIKSIEQAISEITGWKVEFDLETEPTNLITKVNGKELDFDVLPDGLRSLISWIADLLGRVDLLKWQDDMPIFEKNLILLLDEIEVHLHPAWQRRVLPVVQKLFKNSQIFVSTHSPFVVNSVDDAWVYKLELENGKATASEPIKSENSYSISQVLRDIFDIDEKFGKEVQDKLDNFEMLRDKIIGNGANVKDEKELLKLAKSLANEPSDELKQIVLDELRQLSKIKGKDYSL